jgi:hypothetical protein
VESSMSIFNAVSQSALAMSKSPLPYNKHDQRKYSHCPESPTP